MDPMTIIAIINATESGLKMLNSLMEENENALKINILIFFVIVFTIFFGFLWEIDKLGCLFIIIIAESKSLKEDLNLEDLKDLY